MTRFPNLPTLAEVNAVRRATPKVPASLARLARPKAKVQADREDDRKLTDWALKVKDRDDWCDQYTGKRVQKGSRVGVVHPNAGHAHHIEPRENHDVRYDRRNGITLSFATHARVEAGELRIVGTHWFTVKGKRYINADHQVRFVEARRE